MYVEILILTISLLFSAYLFLIRNHDHWKKKGIKSLKPNLFFGNIGPIVFLKKSIGEHLADLYRIYPDEPIIGFFAFDKPCLLIRDPEIIKTIIIKDFNIFSDRVFTPDDKRDPFAAKGLFSIKDSKWKFFRTKLNSGFTSSKIKTMYDVVDECCKLFTDSLKESAEMEKVINIKTFVANHIINAISCCGFGLDVKEVNDSKSPFSSVTKMAFPNSVANSLKMILLFFVSNVTNLLPLQIVPQSTYLGMKSFAQQMIYARIKSNVQKKDFFDIIVEMKKKINENKMELNGDISEDDILVHAFLFLIGGFETSFNILTFILFELAKQPIVQEQLYNEIKSRNNIEINSLKEMKYLDAVFSEALRKYPILPFLDRLCKYDYKLEKIGISIEKGTQVYIPTLALHYDSKYFSNPENFDPERFNNDNICNIEKMTYIPFGEGGRICIGMIFGQVLVKLSLIRLLEEYTFELSESINQIEMEVKSIMLTSKSNIDLKVKLRNHAK